MANRPARRIPSPNEPPRPPKPLPDTLGGLRETGYVPRTVKAEIQANLIDRLQTGQPAFPGIVGFDDTVLPQVNARCSPVMTCPAR